MEQKAREFSKKVHSGQFRKDGVTPYFNHPKEVVGILKDIGIKDEEILTAAWLHDTIEGIVIFSLDKLKELEKEIRILSPDILEEVRALSHNGEDYFKWEVILPKEEVETSGFREGDELEAEAKKGEIKLRKR